MCGSVHVVSVGSHGFHESYSPHFRPANLNWPAVASESYGSPALAGVHVASQSVMFQVSAEFKAANAVPFHTLTRFSVHCDPESFVLVPAATFAHVTEPVSRLLYTVSAVALDFSALSTIVR